MSILDDALAASRKQSAWSLENARKAAALPSMNGGSLTPAQSGTNVLNLRDNTRGEEQAKHYSGWVYASVRPIGWRIAGQPMRVARLIRDVPDVKKKRLEMARRAMAYAAMPPAMSRAYEMGHDVEVLDDHGLLRSINDPNAVMVRWCLIYVTIVSLNLLGRAFWWIVKRDAAEVKDGAPPFEVWPIPANWVRPVHDPDRRKLYSKWRVTPPGDPEGFDVDGADMIYFFYPDFNNPFSSHAPLDAAGMSVRTAEMIGQAQLAQFTNGMNPSWILTVGKDAQVPGVMGTAPKMTLTQNQRNQIVHYIRQFYRGFHRNQEPLILDSLIESAVKASNTPAEMDYHNSASLPKEQITQIFGTNPIIMGQIEGANRASALAADDHFCAGTVNPQICLISETVSAWMGPRFGNKGERYVFYIESARSIDPDYDLKVALALYDRCAIDVDYLRSRFLGLPPAAGGNTAFINPQLVPYAVMAADEAPDGFNPYEEGPINGAPVGGAGASKPGDQQISNKPPEDRPADGKPPADGSGD